MGISQLGYLIVETADIARWRHFATQVIGLSSQDGPNGELYLKADTRTFRILVRPGESERLIASGWEMPTQAAFEALKSQIGNNGVEIATLEKAELAQRYVADLFQVTDPSGNVAEIYWGPISDFTRFNSPVGVKSFVTGDMGLGHVVLPAMNFEATEQFWMSNLGMELSDVLHLPHLAGLTGENARIHFYHCNPRQHSLALAEIPDPTGCIHLMLEVPDIDEVGLALDRAAQHKAPLMTTLGRHVNDDMVSFYIWTPGGFAMEFGCGGMVKDWKISDTVFETTRGSHWGHQYLGRPGD